MKKLVLWLCLIVPAATPAELQAQNQIIPNPRYELRSSGIYSIAKVERGKQATRLTVQCTFVPGYWVMFGTDVFVQDPATGERFYIQELEGGKFGQRIVMPESGEYTLTMTFPPLGKEVKTIDFGERDKELIWGISLDAKNKNKRNTDVPRDVTAWIESEVAKSDTPPVADLHSPLEFFSNEKNARLVGYIKGYDPRLGFSAGSISHNNLITNENLISVIEIEPDGRFTSDVRLASPACPYIRINNIDLEVYLEPGQTLGVILDWENFLELDRKRNMRHSLRPTAFYGPLAAVNREFDENKIRFGTEESKITDPWEFKKHQLDNWQSQSDSLDRAIRTKNISPKAADILRSRIIGHNVLALLDYIYDLEARNRNDEKITRMVDSVKRSGYYDFLRADFMNDPALLVPYESYFVINRYEYSDPPFWITNKLRAPRPEKTFYEYLTGELNVELSTEETGHLNCDVNAQLTSLETEEEREAWLAKYIEKWDEVRKKYEPQFAAYQEKYPLPVPPSELEIKKLELRLRDSTMKNIYLLEPNLIQDIVKVHDLETAFDYCSSREEARELTTYAAFGFANPFIVMWSEKLFNDKFPSGGVEDGAYELPEGKATDIFKRIIDPFRGKLLIVDFWGTNCGPCVLAIKESKRLREGYKDDDRIAFVYITDEKWSHDPAAYNKMVAENFMPHSFRLSTDEWNYLTQLFQINGVPHYILINPDGSVADKRCPSYFDKKNMDELIAKYFPAEGN